MKKFVCLFVSFILVLFSIFGNNIYAEEIEEKEYFYQIPEECYVDMSPEFVDYMNNIEVTEDMLYYYNIFNAKINVSYGEQYDLWALFFTSDEIIAFTHAYTDDFVFNDSNLSNYGSYYNAESGLLNYYCKGKCNYIRYDSETYEPIVSKGFSENKDMMIDFNNKEYTWQSWSVFKGAYDYCYVYPSEINISRLDFYQNPTLNVDMDLNNLSSTFTITSDNSTDSYYDYMVYISDYPSSIGIINSFNSACWFMSSKQWCYQWLNDYSALNGSISDYIADNIADGLKGADILDYTFGNGMYNSLFNAWGGAFDGAKEYFSVDDETMSFYQVSQTNCPVYRINPNDTKTHTISYSSLNLELGKKYYLNIIYMPVDFKTYSAMTAPIIDAATNQGGNYPVFDTRLIPRYSVYDSYEFSVSDGVFSQDSNTFYSYSDLIKYTNPSNSVAKIESDDDEIIVSDNDSYDNSVSTEYINYGQIYHGCTFYNGTTGGSGGSGGLVEENIELKIYGVDDLDFEITQLSEPVSKFQQFMQAVFGFLPEEMVGLFILGISTCIICRILGR